MWVPGERGSCRSASRTPLWGGNSDRTVIRCPLSGRTLCRLLLQYLFQGAVWTPALLGVLGSGPVSYSVPVRSLPLPSCLGVVLVSVAGVIWFYFVSARRVKCTITLPVYTSYIIYKELHGLWWYFIGLKWSSQWAGYESTLGLALKSLFLFKK